MKKLLCLLLLIASIPAYAVSVSPIVKVYTPDVNSGVLTITNTTSSKQSYQIFVYKWSLVNGKQVKKLVKDIRFVPSIVSIEAGQSQTVRFIKKDIFNSELHKEQSYRIKVQQLPKPEWKTDTTKGATTIHRTISMSFPWFWRPKTYKPHLEAHMKGSSLVITNTGKATARMASLVYGTYHKKGLVGYALPGETVIYPVDKKQMTNTLSVWVNGKTKHITVR